MNSHVINGPPKSGKTTLLLNDAIASITQHNTTPNTVLILTVDDLSKQYYVSSFKRNGCAFSPIVRAIEEFAFRIQTSLVSKQVLKPSRFDELNVNAKKLARIVARNFTSDEVLISRFYIDMQHCKQNLYSFKSSQIDWFDKAFEQYEDKRKRMAFRTADDVVYDILCGTESLTLLTRLGRSIKTAYIDDLHLFNESQCELIKRFLQSAQNAKIATSSILFNYTTADMIKGLGATCDVLELHESNQSQQVLSWIVQRFQHDQHINSIRIPHLSTDTLHAFSECSGLMLCDECSHPELVDFLIQSKIPFRCSDYELSLKDTSIYKAIKSLIRACAQKEAGSFIVDILAGLNLNRQVLTQIKQALSNGQVEQLSVEQSSIYRLIESCTKAEYQNKYDVLEDFILNANEYLKLLLSDSDLVDVTSEWVKISSYLKLCEKISSGQITVVIVSNERLLRVNQLDFKNTNVLIFVGNDVKLSDYNSRFYYKLASRSLECIYDGDNYGT